MFKQIAVGSWVEIDDGCPITFEVGGSGTVWFTFGTEGQESFDFAMHSEALRAFLGHAAEALAEMDAIFARRQEEKVLASCAPA